VSSFVIQRKICPLGFGIVSCAFLCKTKTNLGWGAWKPIFLFKHGELMDSRKKVPEERETDRKGKRRNKIGKFTYVKA